MPWDYTPDHVGTGMYLMNEPALRAELERRAYLGLAVAVALAPKRTGRLAASGEVTSDGVGGVNHDRMQVSIQFEVSYAVPASFPDADEDDYLQAAVAVIEAGG